MRCGHCQAIFDALANEVADLEAQPDGESPEPGAEPEGDESAFEQDQVSLFEPPDEELPGAPGRPGDVDVGPDRYPDAEPERGDEERAERGRVREQGAGPAPEPERIELPDSPEGSEDAQESTENQTDHEKEEAKRDPKEGIGFPGEITEEILIEAPPVLWNVFDEETEEKTGDEGSRDSGTAAAVRERARETGDEAQEGGAAGGRAPLRSPYRARDIRMVELPQPRPFKTATLSLLSVLLVLLLVWQIKAFYLDDLAQIPLLRPYVEQLCRPLGCSLPPRRDFAQIDLVGTSIEANPEIPGALEIKASLINRAHFPQPYPPLRITLTDREGRVVGRRTYLPSEYRPGDGEPELLPIREVSNVSINLAQPAENAVGYEVELMSPFAGGGS